MIDAVRILNFDGSLLSQKRLLQTCHPRIVDFTALGPACRHWINHRNAERIRRRLDPAAQHSITFIGSGDFHHLSFLLVEQFTDPVSVIIFDHHPDWDILPPRLGCGSWVSALLKKANVRKVISLGMSSEDLNAPFLFTAGLSALKDDRLEMYPYAHRPSRSFFRRIPKNSSVGVKRTWWSDTIYWQELKHKDIKAFALEIARRLPTRNVYISIDKDCLRSDHALTNWEEGCMGLDELVDMVRILRDNTEIVGMDITGEYSLPRVSGLVKKAVSKWDHPVDFSAKDKPLELIHSVNEETNLRIVEALLGK